MTKTVAIYARISQDRQGEELAIDRQEESCKLTIAAREWTLGETYADVDISAYKRRIERPSYERLLRDIQAGRVECVMVWKMDRLVRRITEFSRFWEACKETQTALVSVTEPVGTSNPVGLGVVYLLVALAEQESLTRSDRAKAKAYQLAQQGKRSGGGFRPFGYKEDRKTVEPAEASLIKEAAESVLNGSSLRAILTDWTKRDVKTVTGTAWTGTVLKGMLIAPRVAGLREYKGDVLRDDAGEPVKAEWRGILSLRTWERVRATLLDRDRLRFSGVAGRKYLLTGFAYCGLCEGKLVARPRDDGTRCYVCVSGPNFHGCGKIKTVSEPLETHVMERVYFHMNDLEISPGGEKIEDDSTDEKTAGIRDEMETKRLRLIELGDMWESGEIERAEYVRLSNKLTNEIDALTKELAKVLTKNGGVDFAALVRLAEEYEAHPFPQEFNAVEFDYWRTALQATVGRIVVIRLPFEGVTRSILRG